MKILRLLNKNYLPIIVAFLFINTCLQAEEQPVDIWNIDKNEVEKSLDNEISITQNNKDELKENSIYSIQSQKEDISVEIDQSLA